MSEALLEQEPSYHVMETGAMIVDIVRSEFDGILRYAPERESKHHSFVLGDAVDFDDPDTAICFNFGGIGTRFEYDAAMKVVMTADGRAIQAAPNTAVGPMFGPTRSIVEMRGIRAVKLSYNDVAQQFENLAGSFRPLDGLSEKQILGGLCVLATDSESVLAFNQVDGSPDTQSMASWTIWRSPELALSGDQLRFR